MSFDVYSVLLKGGKQGQRVSQRPVLARPAEQLHSSLHRVSYRVTRVSVSESERIEKRAHWTT